MQASSSIDSRSSSALSARRRYLFDCMIVIAPYCNLLESAEELYLIEKMSALRSFLVPQTVAVTKTFNILIPQDRISLSLEIYIIDIFLFFYPVISSCSTVSNNSFNLFRPPTFKNLGTQLFLSSASLALSSAETVRLISLPETELFESVGVLFSRICSTIDNM